MAYKIPKPAAITTTRYDVLVGDAGNTIASVGPGSAGQVLQSSGAGVNPAYSTATFPSTATGTGKVLRADGTNWVASTAAYPDTAGSNLNILTSDGTNWISSAPPAAGLGYTLNIKTADNNGSPADSTTYFIQVGNFEGSASGSAGSRMVVPISGTVVAVYGVVTVSGTHATTQNSTLRLRLNNTTDTTITSTLKMSVDNNPFNATVSIAVSAGDYLEFKLTTPIFSTNPTGCAFSGTIYII